MIDPIVQAIIDQLASMRERLDTLERTQVPKKGALGTPVYTGLTAGRVVFVGSDQSLDDDGSLVWDDTNKRLGVGVASPAYPLDVAGAGVQLTGSSSPYLVLNTTSGANKRVGMAFRQSGTQQFELGTDISANNTRDFYLYDNVAGSIRVVVDASGNVNTTGAVCPPRSSGAALFAIDGTSQGSALSIANGNYATPFGTARAFSGIIIISETAVNGNAALYLVDGGGNVTLVGAAGASWSATLGTLAKTNLGIVGTELRLENKLGSTATYNVVAIRSRTV